MTSHSHPDNDDRTLPTHTHLQRFEDWAHHMTWHLEHPTSSRYDEPLILEDVDA